MPPPGQARVYRRDQQADSGRKTEISMSPTAPAGACLNSSCNVRHVPHLAAAGSPPGRPNHPLDLEHAKPKHTAMVATGAGHGHDPRRAPGAPPTRQQHMHASKQTRDQPQVQLHFVEKEQLAQSLGCLRAKSQPQQM